MNLFNLVGKLILDTSDYDKGINDAKNKNAELAEDTGKNALIAAGKWALIVAAIAKVGNSIKGLIVDSTQYVDNIKNMAQIYGYSVQEIQEMQSVAEQSGKSLERVLRGIKSSGQTAAEYLGLSVEEYQAMVDEAYRFGTILSEDSVNAVDALGDRIQYLKSEWTAAITALLAGEKNAEEAVDAFFENVGDLIDENTPRIVSFAVKLLFKVVQGLVQVIPQAVGDLIASAIETLFSVNWIEVGLKLIKSILVGVWRGISAPFRRLFGLDENDEDAIGNAGDFIQTNIRGNDYRVSESVSQKIDVNLRFEGDTPVSSSNAEIIGDALAQHIDEILGRRLDG